MTDLFSRIEEAAEAVRHHSDLEPEVAIILGTGLGALADEVEEGTAVPYAEIPHMPTTTLEAHPGRLILGRLEGKKVVVMQGRFHLYEGYTAQQVTFGVRVMRHLGAGTLVVSNACGGLNPQFRAGDLLLIEDHINLLGANPLIGPNDERLGPRYPDMCWPYDRELLALAEEEALRLGVCDMVVSDLDELLSKLGLAGAARTYITGRGDAYVQLLSLISNPLLQSIMMWLALWLIIIDIFHPTFVLTVIALALLALALWGVGVIGTHPLAVALVILGSALTLVELKKPGIGFEAVGVLMMLLGVLLAYQFEPFMVLGGAEMAILLVVLAGGAVLAYYLFAMRLALRRRPEHHAPERLIGMLGTAKW